MKVFLTLSLCLLFASYANPANAQSYKYDVDLTKVKNDRITVELIAPAISKETTKFYFPRIVPGTYMNSNYGKYIHDLKAYDRSGKELTAKKSGDNAWEIKNARKVYRLVYNVEDTWDSEIDNKVYPMCGTSFEEGKNFVLNTPGIFGYFEDLKKVPFTLSFKKPLNFYAATGLKPISTSASSDEFICANADELYDSPIMFSLPDTTSLRVGNAQVLVAVYSPGKLATSKFIAENLEKLLMGTKNFLGGKLPVDKYAFIYYFNRDQKKFTVSGAWEHSYSSFYALEEAPQEKSIKQWIDISAHEFFHIVTPLTISSREVKEFNFNEANLSKHLWLYEGSTEYDAHYMQVKEGLHPTSVFFNTLSQKINFSRSSFRDSLSFTELSTEAAGKWKDQFGNVYMKGALISASLDLLLLDLSDGKYGLNHLKQDLGVKFGKDKYFNDETLFDDIASLTYPQVKEFMIKYVQGTTPIPYEKYFALAGVEYIPKLSNSTFTIGGFGIKNNPEGKFIIGTTGMNAFGTKIGYQDGDELVSLNGNNFTKENFSSLLEKFYAGAKEGDPVEIVVNRNGQPVKLTAPAMKVNRDQFHVVRFTNSPTPRQIMIRDAWLGTKTEAKKTVKKVNPAPGDVSGIDNIVKALYDVLSGPAGARNWDRFRSLFHPDAYMGTISPNKQLAKFSPEDYIKNNGPFLEKNAFYENEIGRTVNQFGNIAQVFSAYEYKLGVPVQEQKRGINSIELVNENGRWSIMSITWNEETKETAIPSRYIGNK